MYLQVALWPGQAARQSVLALLFTERAVADRVQHGFDHRKVRMAVVVLEMLLPHAACQSICVT